MTVQGCSLTRHYTLWGNLPTMILLLELPLALINCDAEIHEILKWTHRYSQPTATIRIQRNCVYPIQNMLPFNYTDAGAELKDRLWTKLHTSNGYHVLADHGFVSLRHYLPPIWNCEFHEHAVHWRQVDCRQAHMASFRCGELAIATATMLINCLPSVQW